MSDDVRTLLDFVPAPDPKPVDLAAIYRAAAERQAAVSRHWRRVAVGVAALAASVLLFALLPRIEFRITDHEFAMRWGSPPEPPPVPPTPPDPRIERLMEEQSHQLAALRATNAKHAELQDLLLTLATDVNDRDRQQQARLAAVTKKLTAFEADTARQFADAEKTHTALYDAVFTARKVKTGP